MKQLFSKCNLFIEEYPLTSILIMIGAGMVIMVVVDVVLGVVWGI